MKATISQFLKQDTVVIRQCQSSTRLLRHKTIKLFDVLWPSTFVGLELLRPERYLGGIAYDSLHNRVSEHF
jgi:hypothetical protein